MEKSTLGQHISGQFNKELEDIRNKVLNMGGLVEQQIELAVEAFYLDKCGVQKYEKWRTGESRKFYYVQHTHSSLDNNVLHTVLV